MLSRLSDAQSLAASHTLAESAGEDCADDSAHQRDRHGDSQLAVVESEDLNELLLGASDDRCIEPE
jgi:hypothetical protein